MVRRRNKKRGSDEELPSMDEDEFYRRFGGGPVAFTRPSSTVAQPRQPQEETPREQRRVGWRENRKPRPSR